MGHPSAAGVLLLAVHAAAAEPEGFRSVTIPAEDHGRKMSGALWYPSAGGEAFTPQLFDLASGRAEQWDLAAEASRAEVLEDQ